MDNPNTHVDPLGLTSCPVPKDGTRLGKETGSSNATKSGPLAESMAGTFTGSRYKEIELASDTVLYRAGTAKQPLGQFFSSEPPLSVLQTRIDKAVLPVWPGGAKSPIDTSFEVKIPAGTKVYVGEAPHKEESMWEEPSKLSSYSLG